MQEELDPRVARILKPEETAIIVVDVMNGYCNSTEPLAKYLKEYFGFSLTELDKAADRMVAFLAASRKFPVASTIFVRMIERYETLPPNLCLKMEVEKAPDVAEKDGQGWSYYKVKPEQDDKEIVKYSYDAFMDTNLDKHLKDKGIKTVIVFGGFASVCVGTTAQTAAQHGYHTFVPADLTADPGPPSESQTPETIRKKLDSISVVMGYMPLSSTILNIWRQQTSVT